MRASMWICLSACMTAWLASGCAATPASETRRSELDDDVRFIVNVAKREYPGIARFFESSAGYAVFPNVGRGAVGAGGAFGRGELYEKGVMTGYCTLTQATIGIALGGQSYSEIIFFDGTESLKRFKYRDYAFAAQASAVALKSGEAVNARYDEGVAVFTLVREGLMFEASVGGQRFGYEPK
jgi:hypothetical protein